MKQLVETLEDGPDSPIPAPLYCDILDQQRDLLHEPAWCDTITHQIAQFCAAYFDRDQADWRPDQQQALYASWRHTLMHDHSVALLMKASQIPGKAKTLCADPAEQIQLALEQLGIDPAHWQSYLEAVLLRVSGWAAWCAYRRWQARLEQGEDDTLIELLAIRLSWECLIDDGKRFQGSVWNRWQSAWREHFQAGDSTGQQVHLLWQRAHEISYQQTLLGKLLNTDNIPLETVEPKVQAVFCIDVRSEVFRRHLEAQSQEIQTLGFAGFFGLPISYTPLGTAAERPQLPGLLAPALAITDSCGHQETDRKIALQRTTSLSKIFNWKPFQTVPASAFTLVETLGLGYAGKLIKRSLPGTGAAAGSDNLGLKRAQSESLRPTLDGAITGGVGEQVTLAKQVLTGMNLTQGHARLVLLVGHGSQNQNNPQRAGLDCGACCGQTGEVNSRALTQLLNNPEVRQGLADQGIHIPESTRFVAGLHNTTTDEVNLFDVNQVPDTHAADLELIRLQLADAGKEARRERAPALGLAHLTEKPAALNKAIRKRANDWAQTRPEWGLANNAAFIVAPRSRTRGINLQGRSFLHEYDHRHDPEGSLLEQIMTAPMIVTHWINMQYHASTVDNKRYGSGNKTLHNVVGGRLGVFEGNGGDLRIGLAWQSVHDGEQWRHEPLRLTVVIDAPQAVIDRIIDKHPMVKALLDNQWLYLVRLAGNDSALYRNSSWQTWQQIIEKT